MGVVMGDHWPLCEQYISGDGLPCICELLTEQTDIMEAALRVDLRTKIEALRADAEAFTGTRLIIFADVLDLIDGSSDGDT
jgi:hypothetical protein